MWVLAAAFAVLVLALSLMVLLPISVKVHAEGGIDHIDFRVKVKPPLWPWYIRMPDLGRWAELRTAKDKKAQPAEGAPQPDEPAARPVQERVSQLAKQFRRLYPRAKDAVITLMRALTFERLHIEGQAGTGDAYETAMLCGTANTVTGLFLSVARRHGVRFGERPVIRLSPIFDRPYLFLYADIETSFSIFGVLKVAASARRLLKAHTYRSSRRRGALSSCESVEY